MDKKTILTVDIKVSDFDEVKEILLKQQEKIERYEKALEFYATSNIGRLARKTLGEKEHD
jgi:hypothetical protein